jgi:hypothetical protein
VFKHTKELSRKFRANPSADQSFYNMLKKNHSIDLRNNYKIIDHGNGYDTILPLDKNKKF